MIPILHGFNGLLVDFIPFQGGGDRAQLDLFVCVVKLSLAALLPVW